MMVCLVSTRELFFGCLLVNSCAVLAVGRKSDCTAGAVNYVTPPNSVCSYGVLNVTQRSIR